MSRFSVRLLVSAFIVFSFFFFGINFAKASDEKIALYENAYKQLKSQNFVMNYGGVDLENVESVMKELDNVLSESGMYYIMNVTFTGSFGNYHFADVIIYEYASSTTNFTVKNKSTSSGTYELAFSSDGDFVRAVKIEGYKAYSNNKKATPIFRDLIEYIEENKHLPSTATDVPKISLVTSSSFNANIYSTSFCFNMIYSSNMSMKLSSLIGIDGFKIGESIYRKNALMPTYANTKGYGKTYYSFTDTINTLGKSQVRFKFDVPENKIFPFEFNYSVSYVSDGGTSSLGAPFLEYKTFDDSQIEHTYSLPLEHFDFSNGDVVYNGTEINVFPENTTSVEFVVDLYNKKNLNDNVFIHFDSQYPFTYEYITDDSYIEIDFTGNYGVLLIPKVKNLTNLSIQSVYSKIYYKGPSLFFKKYNDYKDLSTPDYSAPSVKTDNYTPYSHYFSSEYPEQVLFIIYEDYALVPGETFIKIDPYYFDYSICETSESCGVIKNPNTGVEIKPLPPTVLRPEGEEFFESIINRFLDPIYEKLPIIQQIPEIWKVFNDSIFNPKPPEWKIDLNGIGFNTVVYMDFTFFDQYRTQIFFIIQLAASYVTLRKLLNIIGDYFD